MTGGVCPIGTNLIGGTGTTLKTEFGHGTRYGFWEEIAFGIVALLNDGSVRKIARVILWAGPKSLVTKSGYILNCIWMHLNALQSVSDP